MSEERTPIVAPDGRPARRPSKNCPGCGAGEDSRINTAGFGPPVICCRVCGHHFEGAKEC